VRPGLSLVEVNLMRTHPNFEDSLCLPVAATTATDSARRGMAACDRAGDHSVQWAVETPLQFHA
jgi:hypothetical protein